MACFAIRIDGFKSMQRLRIPGFRFLELQLQGMPALTGSVGPGSMEACIQPLDVIRSTILFIISARCGP
jgi:hypothetical protein